MTNVGIVGTGIYIPESFMTGKEISEKTMGVWSEEAVVNKLGIRKKPIPSPSQDTVPRLTAISVAFGLNSM